MASTDLLSGFQFLTSARIPPELVLKTIQHLPFDDGKLIAVLRTLDSRLKDIIALYERSLTRWFMQKEVYHAWSDFPPETGFNLDWLGQCVERYDLIDAIMDELTWRDNCMAIAKHNMSAANAGFYLLYRLLSKKNHSEKLTYIKSLSQDPLTAIYLALHHSTLTSRYHGAGWIAQRNYGRFMDSNQLSLRNELEFCFAEATLSVGPEFVYDMVVNPSDPAGETTLLNFYHEHGIRDWEWPCWGSGTGEFEPPRTQGPDRASADRQPALFSIMLMRMAELEQCPVERVRDMIEDRTDSEHHSVAYLDLRGKARLIRGLNVR